VTPTRCAEQPAHRKNRLFLVYSKELCYLQQKRKLFVPKRQLTIQADLIINCLRWEALVDRQLDAFDVDNDAPHVPSTEPLSNPQSRRKPVHVS